MFAYCANDPINRHDPSGFIWDFMDIGMAALSWADFAKKPSMGGLALAVVDTVACAPVIPSTGYVRRGAKVVDKVADVKKINISKPKPYSNPKIRPKYGKSQIEDVWNYAKDIDGRVYDPNTGEELFWDRSKSRAGQWDMGHTTENKYSEWHKKYMNGGITKDEFSEWYRNSNNYRPESPSSNRSHRYE